MIKNKSSVLLVTALDEVACKYDNSSQSALHVYVTYKTWSQHCSWMQCMCKGQLFQCITFN